MHPTRPLTLASLACLLGAPVLSAQDTGSLARYFGFDEPRIIVVDDGVGPILAADVNGDGLNDLIAVNNRKSRIEVHVQRRTPLTDAEVEANLDVNELPKSKFYRRVDVGVAHRVMAVQPHDLDSDGRLDLLYAGRPGEIVAMMQRGEGEMRFEAGPSRRVRGMALGQDGFAIADVTGDAGAEVLAIVDGRINVYELTEDGPVGTPDRLGSTDGLVAFFVDDFDGDGRQDVLGAIPEDASPLRLWLRSDAGDLGAELRFEMPVIIEAEPVRLEGRRGASIAVIERPTRRMVLYDIERVPIEVGLGGSPGTTHEVTAEVHAFAGEADRERSVSITDLDTDGDADLIATDANANRIIVYRQGRRGLDAGTPYSSFKEPKAVVTGPWGGSSPAVFVLSEEEKTVGVSAWQDGRLGFPQPIALATAGSTPVAIGYIEPSDAGPRGEALEPVLAIVVRDGRDHTLELHRMSGDSRAFELEGVTRPPQSMLAGDYDGDGSADLALFTPGEPMVMVTDLRAAFAGNDALAPVVRTEDDMPQFGLVDGAGPDNTALLDVDRDGRDELLIADANFVRAAAFDAERGWRVVEQVNMPEAGSTLAGLTVLDGAGAAPVIVAADSSLGEIAMLQHGAQGWGVTDRLVLEGVELGPIRAGAFSGDGEPNIMAITPEAFALVRLSGETAALEAVSTFRSDEEDRLEHEIEVGDVNSDGYLDLVVLDAREQMLQLFSISASRQLRFATEFEVFESRIFTGGERNQFEPSYAVIEDVTGDGAVDIALEVHDRIVIYPQQTSPID
ncbi:MAG: VCBS repeat-containing protein [Planctomycetota bacterium]